MQGLKRCSIPKCKLPIEKPPSRFAFSSKGSNNRKKRISSNETIFHIIFRVIMLLYDMFFIILATSFINKPSLFASTDTVLHLVMPLCCQKN